MQFAEQDSQLSEQDYNAATVQYNEMNLLLAKQQSKLNALEQEQQFKERQFVDLQVQIAQSETQHTETVSEISQCTETVSATEADLL
ncbi:hypothetical protein ABTM58_20290, partial [Acinetobacter baumannii]